MKSRSAADTPKATSKHLTIGNSPKYVSSQPSTFMKTLAEEDIHNRMKRNTNDDEYGLLGKEVDEDE